MCRPEGDYPAIAEADHCELTFLDNVPSIWVSTILTLNVANHLNIKKSIHLLIKQVYQERNVKLIEILYWWITELSQKDHGFWGCWQIRRKTSKHTQLQGYNWMKLKKKTLISHSSYGILTIEQYYISLYQKFIRHCFRNFRVIDMCLQLMKQPWNTRKHIYLGNSAVTPKCRKEDRLWSIKNIANLT